MYETDINKVKKVEFEVIDRYLRYLKRVYLGSESEEGIELGAPDSDGFESFKRVPNPGKIFSFAHNLERFRTHPTQIHHKQVETFITVLDYLGRIFFRLPRLFYRFPSDEKDLSEDQKRNRYENQTRVFRAMIRALLFSIIDVWIIIAKELESIPKEEQRDLA